MVSDARFTADCADCRLSKKAQVPFHFQNMTIDHIRPRSRGGTDDPGNLQLLCAACNSTKGNRTQDELIQSLREQGVIREDIQEY